MTSWENIHAWYDTQVGQKGHKAHQEVILPHFKPYIKKIKGQGWLDVGCGQGWLERQLPPAWHYVGIDTSRSLLQSAQAQRKRKTACFVHQNACAPYTLEEKFDVVSFILSLQNMQHPAKALRFAGQHLHPGGSLLLVLNHPCFRIPQHSDWIEKGGTRYRAIGSYQSPRTISIALNPSQGKRSAHSTSFHSSLTQLFAYCHQAHFKLHHLEEWCSTATSTGKKAEEENRSRSEIPLFLFLHCTRL